MNPDFRDLFAGFNAHGVEYLVVGAHAMAVHGHVRATKDLNQNKRASGRTQDLADLERLEGLKREDR